MWHVNNSCRTPRLKKPQCSARGLSLNLQLGRSSLGHWPTRRTPDPWNSNLRTLPQASISISQHWLCPVTNKLWYWMTVSSRSGIQPRPLLREAAQSHTKRSDTPFPALEFTTRFHDFLGYDYQSCLAQCSFLCIHCHLFKILKVSGF